MVCLLEIVWLLLNLDGRPEAMMTTDVTSRHRVNVPVRPVRHCHTISQSFIPCNGFNPALQFEDLRAVIFIVFLPIFMIV